MKRFLNALLVFVLVFTLAVPAMAAAPADVKGTDYEDAVAQLTALGIINGYEDGTYRPANDITRAEFAKIIVVATGNEGAADILKGTSAFSDVSGDAWYSGYVAAAASFGFVKGYGDGTFGPNKNVTGQEVVTVLLRALGYNDELPGNWPYDYLIKANSLGLLEGLDFTGPANANRGLVAQLTANTLEQNLVTYNSETKLFDDEGVAFIDEKLDADFTDAVVVEPALNADDEIVLSTGAKAFAKGAYVGDWSLGQNVRYLTNADGEITYISAADNDVVEGTLDGALTEASTSLTLDDDDSTVIDFVYSGLTVYYNNELMGATFTVPDESDVKVFLDDDEARFVIADKFTNTNEFFDEYLPATSYRDAKITTNVDTYNVLADAKITKDGKASSLSKLAADDIVDLKLNSADEVVEIKATTPTNITGEVTSKVVRNGDTFYKVGGVEYESLVALSVATEYDLVLNADGVIVKADLASDGPEQEVVVVSVEAVSILKDSVVEDVYKTLLFNVETGVTTTYYDAFDMTANVGDYGKVEFDADGAIDTWTFTQDVSLAGTSSVATVGTDSITVDGSTYAVDNSTVFVNLYNTDNELDPSFMNFADLEDGADLFYVTDGSYTLDLVFVETGGTATSDAVPVVTGFVTGVDATTDADGTTYAVTLNVDGATEVLDVDLDPSTYLDKLVRYDDANDKDGSYDSAATVATDFATGTLLNVSSNVIESTYLATSSTVVYVIDADGNLSVGDLADVADLDGATVGTDVASVSYLVAENLDADDQPDGTPKMLGSYEVLEAIVITLK